MFTATYPATFVRERDGKGLHVRFPDLPEALTGGDDLAAILHVSETVVGRMLDPKNNTKPERIHAALSQLGQRIVVTFEDAA
jgi:hypothetical protein